VLEGWPLDHGKTYYVCWGVHNGSLGVAARMVKDAKARGFNRVAFQCHPDNDAFAEAVRVACQENACRYAAWFDTHAPGDVVAALEWYDPQEYILNVESFTRDLSVEIPRIRAARPGIPLAVITNFWGITPEITRDTLLPAEVSFHVEAYRYEATMDRPELEKELLDYAHRVLGVPFEHIQLTLGMQVDHYTVSDYHDYDTSRFGIYPAEYYAP
jgi:hypothetical protein